MGVESERSRNFVIDEPTFERWVREHSQQLAILARLVLGRIVGAHELGASDVVQETLHGAWKDRPQFNGTTEVEFRRWINQICRNKVNKLLRDRRALKRQLDRQLSINAERSGDCSLSKFVAADDRSAASQLQRQEELDRLVGELELLPERQREVLQLKYFEGLKSKEIAELLGLTPGAVIGLQQRGLRRLRDRFDGSHGDSHE